MTAPATTLEPPARSSANQVENLLLQDLEAGKGAVVAVAGDSRRSLKAHDFRSAPLLSARDLQKLRLHQTEFVNALASRLSMFLRLEFTLKLSGLQTVIYRKLVETWANPTCLTLFKAEPLAGVGLLEIAPRLGSAIVDRLMGGPGEASDSSHEFSEIEKAILEQASQLIIGEWCGNWHGAKEFKPGILGHESNGRFVQVVPPETVMLVVSLELRLAGEVETIQIAFPYASLEALIRQLSQGTNSTAEAVPTPTKPAPKWNTCFDDVRVPVAARWHWSELTARDLFALKIGDVLQVDPESAAAMEVCVADLPRFIARPGIVSGKWAVELGRPLKD
ncbi:MAG TPA: flagellar motor switch protein FliM [Verrucomicrobiae bacterium]|jgi:flagellar motor switch protein FliM|nr:flagellar motor switch protein FliM [Verrucomicrobiae bacterium]